MDELSSDDDDDDFAEKPTYISNSPERRLCGNLTSDQYDSKENGGRINRCEINPFCVDFAKG